MKGKLIRLSGVLVMLCERKETIDMSKIFFPKITYDSIHSLP